MDCFHYMMYMTSPLPLENIIFLKLFRAEREQIALMAKSPPTDLPQVGSQEPGTQSVSLMGGRNPIT